MAESPADSCNRTKISSGVSPNQSSTASTSPHPRALQSPFCMNVIKLTHMGTHVALDLPVFLGARGRKWVLKCFFQLFLLRKRLLLTTPSSRLCPCCYEGQRVNGCFRASFYLETWWQHMVLRQVQLQAKCWQGWARPKHLNSFRKVFHLQFVTPLSVF